MRNIIVKLFCLDQWLMRCCLKDFLSRALVALAGPFMQFWQKTLWGTNFKFGPAVQEMLF